MGWFENAFLWPRMLASSEGRDQMLEDIKYGKGSASAGSPLHGLTAGLKLHELMSPTVHINDRIQDLRSNGTSGHFSRMRDDMHHYAQDAFKENIPALLGWMGGAAAGVGEGGGLVGGAGGGAAGGAAEGGGYALSGGDAAALEAANASAAMSGTSGASSASGMGMNAAGGGTNWLGMASNGLSLLNAAQPQQQQQPLLAAPQQQTKPNQSQQQRALDMQRIQELQLKTRLSPEERSELQELQTRNRQTVIR